MEVIRGMSNLDKDREEREIQCPQCKIILYYKEDIDEVFPCSNCGCDNPHLPYDEIPEELKIQL